VVARLVVSLSGLSDDASGSLARAAAFAAALDARGVPLSQLVRPCGPAGPLPPDAPLVAWLRGRPGDALVLHGYDHSADPLVAGQLARVGRRAEFAALPRHEAGLRLVAARRALTATGLRTDAFVPPRWLASPGTLDALREQRFAVCADDSGVRLLDSGTLVRARVLGFRASGEARAVAENRRAAEAWRARLLVAEVARTARRGGLVRIAVRAKDLRRASRRDAVLAAVDAALALGAAPATYRSPALARAA
jgi:uncharacterized protein